MAQEIKPQAIPPRPRAVWAPLFQSAGGSEPDSEGPGAGGWQCSTSSNAEKKSGPAGKGRGQERIRNLPVPGRAVAV